MTPDLAKTQKGMKGYALLELVIALVVISVMMPASMVVFQQVMVAKTLAENTIVAANLAQEVVEHITQQRFSDIAETPLRAFDEEDPEDIDGTCSGRDHNYNPYCDKSIRNYFYEVRLQGVNEDDLTGTGTPVTSCAGAVGGYCRVEVLVSNPAIATIRLTSLVTNTQ